MRKMPGNYLNRDPDNIQTGTLSEILLLLFFFCFFLSYEIERLQFTNINQGTLFCYKLTKDDVSSVKHII